MLLPLIVIPSSANLLDTVIANGGAHNGDVYKVTAPSDGPFVTFRVGNQTTGPSADVGDLIIFHGTEATSGDYAGQILIGGTGVSNGAAGNSNNYTPGALLSQCELVPSGDEPEVMADVPAATNIIWLKDGKNGASTNIL